MPLYSLHSPAVSRSRVRGTAACFLALKSFRPVFTLVFDALASNTLREGLAAR